ncbi:T9SS type A sorting domain-containing protein [Maribellus sp. YY47]|uniref:T9SS type A sorting domain-containing protein n=1 Tax=Maribellus sp. YY47 TaxID=2929486 RepID=UPI002000DA8F|nr:T9SS type A sorting domain-containing protein [Maribellus sp. YY47]
MENRQLVGFDVGLDGAGLAIWHINTTKTTTSHIDANDVNADENLKGVDLEEADGNLDLDNNTNRGDDGDLFPGSSCNSSFGDNTTPNSRTYSPVVNTNKPIENIVESGNNIRFDFMGYNPISGPSTVCSGAAFTINNPPPGTTVFWNESSNLTENPTGTFTANGSGEGWVQPTITTGCGNITLPRKNVWVGTPDPAYIDFINIGPNYPGSMVLCEDMPNDGKVSWDATGSIQEYSWSVFDDGSNYWQVIQHPMELYPAIPMQDVQISKPYGSVNGYVNVKVKAKNTCGWGNYSAPSLQFTTATCYGYYLAFSPNPTVGETTISVEQGNPEENLLKSASVETAFDETAEWDLEVYDSMQSLKMKKQKLKGSSATINTQSWKEGVYMVRVKYKDEMLTAKLVVKK